MMWRHEAAVRRHPTRGFLWMQGHCYHCDWTTEARYNDRGGLMVLVDEHIAATGECSCYSYEYAEWDPAGPCAHCRAVAS